MGRAGWILAMGLWAAPLVAQQQAAPATPPAPPEGSFWKADPKDVGSIDAIMKAVYEVISGPAGQTRNWARMHSLFVPNARLGPAVRFPTGRVIAQLGSLDEWIANAEPALMSNGFFEKEIGRRTETFGRIAHVFSTYQSTSTADGAPFSRGINSLQLLFDGARWWIVSVYWDQERADNPIPAKYLQMVP